MELESVNRVRVLVLIAVLLLVIGGVAWWANSPGQSPEMSDQVATGPAIEDSPLSHAVAIRDTQPDVAMRILRSIEPESLQYLEAQRHLAYLGLTQGDNQLAEDALTTLASADPGDAAVQLALAELLFKTGKSNSALTAIRNAIALNPERSLSYLLLAEILDDLHRPAEMVAPLREALVHEPGLFEAHGNLAYALQFCGQLDEAEAEARWCLDRRPGSHAIRSVLAEILRDQGRYDEALQETHAVLKANSHDLEMLLLKADILLYQQRGDEAYAALKPYDTQYSQSRQYIEALARAAMLSGHRDEAVALRKTLPSLLPERVNNIDQNEFDR